MPCVNAAATDTTMAVCCATMAASLATWHHCIEGEVDESMLPARPVGHPSPPPLGRAHPAICSLALSALSYWNERGPEVAVRFTPASTAWAASVHW
jgi:hypothetical protein